MAWVVRRLREAFPGVRIHLRGDSGEGQPCTWRTRLIKVAARVRQTTRRVIVELSSSWPYLAHFYQVSRCLLLKLYE